MKWIKLGMKWIFNAEIGNWGFDSAQPPENWNLELK